MVTTMELRNRLREVRTQSGLTQEELARAVGVTRQTIIAIEKGGYTPSVKLSLTLAHLLQIPLDELFWLAEARGKET
jgi:putative transcriptional regulator